MWSRISSWFPPVFALGRYEENNLSCGCIRKRGPLHVIENLYASSWVLHIFASLKPSPEALESGGKCSDFQYSCNKIPLQSCATKAEDAAWWVWGKCVILVFRLNNCKVVKNQQLVQFARNLPSFQTEILGKFQFASCFGFRATNFGKKYEFLSWPQIFDRILQSRPKSASRKSCMKLTTFSERDVFCGLLNIYCRCLLGIQSNKILKKTKRQHIFLTKLLVSSFLVVK